MNYLTIILTSACNFKCPECPMGEYRKSMEDPRNYNYINLDKLSEFLRDLIDPCEWVVELTGGEPTLCKEYVPTVNLLARMGYRVSVLTNTANMNAIGRQPNLKYFCTWHETQMDFKTFSENIQNCSNECYAVYYPNKKTETDAKILFDLYNVPYVYCSWNEDLFTFGQIMQKLKIPYIPFESITINNVGEISVCAKMKPYANLYNYASKNKYEFMPKQKTCTGFPTICPVWFRNIQAWGI